MWPATFCFAALQLSLSLALELPRGCHPDYSTKYGNVKCSYTRDGTFRVPVGITRITAFARGADGGHAFNATESEGRGGVGGALWADFKAENAIIEFTIGNRGQTSKFLASGGMIGGGSAGQAVSKFAGGGGGATRIRYRKFGEVEARTIIVAGAGAGGAFGIPLAGHGGRGESAGSPGTVLFEDGTANPATPGTPTEPGKGCLAKSGRQSASLRISGKDAFQDFGGNGGDAADADQAAGSGGGAGLFAGGAGCGGANHGTGAGGSSGSPLSPADREELDLHIHRDTISLFQLWVEPQVTIYFDSTDDQWTKINDGDFLKIDDNYGW